MRFSERKRRQPPAVIIVSLIDVLMVVLIFLMVTTTFKTQPSVRLTLPESKQQKDGAGDQNVVVVTIAKVAPHLYLETIPVTYEKLQTELTARARRNPAVVMAIRADQDAPFGQIVKVMDAAKTAGIKNVSAFTQKAGK